MSQEKSSTSTEANPTRRPRRHRTPMMYAMALMTAATCAACTGTRTPSPTDTSSASHRSSAPARASTIAERLAAYTVTSDRLFRPPSTTVQAARDMSTQTLQSGQWELEALRNEDTTAHPGGEQRLTVYCTGTGHYDLLMQVGSDGVGSGKQSVGSEHVRCTPQTTIETTSASFNVGATPTVITITPTPGTVAVLAYHLSPSQDSNTTSSS